MINKEKILIYKKYKGDIDAWARIGTKSEKSLISDDDWYLIDSTIQDIVIFRTTIVNKLKEITVSDDIIDDLFLLSEELG